MDVSTEQILLSRARLGEYSAFEEMVDPMRVLLFRLCYGIIQDSDLAEHATLQAIDKAWWAVGTCNGSFRHWLYRITKNQALGIIDKAEYKYTVPLNGDCESSETADSREPFEDGVIRQHDLEAAFLRLPERYEDLLRLRYYCDLDWNEVADMLEISSVNARKLHERAIKYLRTVYSNPPCDPLTPGRSPG